MKMLCWWFCPTIMARRSGTQGEGCQSDPSAFPAFSSCRACKGTDCGDAELVGKLLLPLIFYVYIVLSLIWVSEFGNRTCWPMRLRRFLLRNILDGRPTMGMIPRIPTIIPVASVIVYCCFFHPVINGTYPCHLIYVHICIYIMS